MKFFFYAVYIHMKRILNSGYFAIYAIIILLIFAAGTYLSKSQHELIIKIGILYNAESETESSIHKILSDYSNLDVTVYATEAEAQKAVASGKIACAYIFNDVEQKLADNDFTEFAISLQPPYTSAGGIINQLMYSAIIKAVAPKISYDYLERSSGGIRTYNEIQNIIEGYFNDGIFVKAEEVSENIELGAAQKSNDIKFLDGRHIIHGIIALVIFLFILLNSASRISDNSKNIYFRMNSLCKIANEAAYSTALYLTGAIFIFFCIWFVQYIFPEFAYPISNEIISALALTFCLTSINMLLIVALPRAEHIFTNAAIIFITVCIFGNVFFDISILSDMLGNIQRFTPTYYYISSLKSDTGGVATLFISGIIIYAVCFVSRAISYKNSY